MTEETIFDPSTNEDQQQDPQLNTPSIPTGLEELVGSGKKYQSVEDALKSVPHAQKHIQSLEQEMAQLKEELSKRKTAAELLDEVKSGFLPENTPQAVEFDQDSLVRLVNQTITQKEQQKIAKDNTVFVANKFKEVYGEQAEAVYTTLAKESGLSVAQLNTLAATSPNAVVKLAGFDKKSTIPAKTSGSINTESLKFAANPNQELSARVPKGATTKDLVNAWKIAGEKVKQNSTI